MLVHVIATGTVANEASSKSLPDQGELLTATPKTGIWRILRMLDEVKVKTTFLTCGGIAERYPDAMKAIVAQGHEVAGHGYHHEIARGLRVLDFAAGSGLVAIAACKAGAAHVLAADIDPFAETACRLNMAANGVAFDFIAEDLIGPDVPCDVLLAGDVFYDRALAEHILPWFRALAERGTAVLVGDPGRTYLPKDGLTRLATYSVPVTRALEDAEVKRTTVWRLT
jgi:predicted nicotinamide N-methyase